MARSIIMLVCVLACMPAHSSPTNLTFEPIALSGQQAAGLDTGVTYRSLSIPALNTPGDVAFLAELQGPGVTYNNRNSVWTTTNRTPSLVARKGDAAPGFDGPSKFDFFDFPTLSDSGVTAFYADPHGLWSGTPSELNAIAVRGGAAPVSDPSATFEWFTNHPSSLLLFGAPALNSQGQAAFWGSTTNPHSITEHGVFSQGGGALHAVAISGNHAPGAPSHVTFTQFGNEAVIRPAFNDLGYTAFSAQTTTAANRGIWRENANGLTAVARTSDPVPGMPTGTSFVDFSDPRLNNAGQTTFSARMQGSGVSADNDTAMWLEDSGSFTIIAREGSQAPGLANGTNFSDFENTPLINREGQTAFRSALTGIDVDSTNDSAIFAELSGSLDLIVREGDQALGAAEGVVFDEFAAGYGFGGDLFVPWPWFSMNANGYMTFYAELRGTGVDDTNDRALYACTPDGDLIQVARHGDQFEVAPGDARTIEWFEFHVGSGGEDGYERGLNDANQLALTLNFTDDSSGIFMVQVPEPTTVCFLVLGGLITCCRRRRA